MNHSLKPSYVTSYTSSLSFFGAVSFFHSSPILERKKRSSWCYGRGLYSLKRSNIYEKRIRKMESKRSLLKDVSEYAEYLFQSWKDDDSTVWFRRPYWSKGAKLNGFGLHESQSGRCKNKSKCFSLVAMLRIVALSSLLFFFAKEDLISAPVMMMMLRTYSIVLLGGKDILIGPPVVGNFSGDAPLAIFIKHPQNGEMKLMKKLLLIIAHSLI